MAKEGLKLTIKLISLLLLLTIWSCQNKPCDESLNEKNIENYLLAYYDHPIRIHKNELDDYRNDVGQVSIDSIWKYDRGRYFRSQYALDSLLQIEAGVTFLPRYNPSVVSSELDKVEKSVYRAIIDKRVFGGPGIELIDFEKKGDYYQVTKCLISFDNECAVFSKPMTIDCCELLSKTEKQINIEALSELIKYIADSNLIGTSYYEHQGNSTCCGYFYSLRLYDIFQYRDKLLEAGCPKEETALFKAITIMEKLAD